MKTVIKKGLQVKVRKGKDRGVTGEVLAMVKSEDRAGNMMWKAVVKGVNIVKKSQKPNPTLNLPGGIIEIEKPISVANLELVKEAAKKPKTTKAAKTTKKVEAAEEVAE